MPGMNEQGPLGKGPLTGGQRGVCNQTQTGTDKTGQPQGTPVDVVPGQGRGLGRCQGGAVRGQGRGQGRGGKR